MHLHLTVLRAKVLVVTLLIGPVAPGCGSEGAAVPDVVSGFDTATDSWRIESFDTDESGWTTRSPTVDEVQHSDLGNPGGCLYRSEEAYGRTEYFTAPARFLGDMGAMSGGSLSFDLRQEESRPEFSFDAPDLILEGGAVVLRHAFSRTPAVEWTHYRVPLGAGAWRHLSDGAAASEDDMQTVLGGLTSLRIRGEYDDGIDASWLDNVVLSGD